MDVFSQGAEALIYSTRLYGREILIKFRAPKRYRIRELDEVIRASRTRSEAKLMVKAAQLGVSVPRVAAVGENEIYIEKIDGKLLSRTPITKRHSRLAGEQLARLHRAGITHGDFTPANLISGKDKIYLIDFGLAQSTSSTEERALDLLLMKRQISEGNYREFAKAYSRAFKPSGEVLRRLEEIEERGRYQTRTLG